MEVTHRFIILSGWTILCDDARHRWKIARAFRKAGVRKGALRFYDVRNAG